MKGQEHVIKHRLRLTQDSLKANKNKSCTYIVGYDGSSCQSPLTVVEQNQVNYHLPIFIYCPWRLAVLHVELCLWEIYLCCAGNTLAS